METEIPFAQPPKQTIYVHSMSGIKVIITRATEAKKIFFLDQIDSSSLPDQQIILIWHHNNIYIILGINKNDKVRLEMIDDEPGFVATRDLMHVSILPWNL